MNKADMVVKGNKVRKGRVSQCKGKANLFLSLIKHHTMKAYGVMELQFHAF